MSLLFTLRRGAGAEAERPKEAEKSKIRTSKYATWEFPPALTQTGPAVY